MKINKVIFKNLLRKISENVGKDRKRQWKKKKKKANRLFRALHFPVVRVFSSFSLDMSQLKQK